MIANYEICYNGLSNGLGIFYGCITFGIGTMFLVASFFKSEMMTKLKIDTKMHPKRMYTIAYRKALRSNKACTT